MQFENIMSEIIDINTLKPVVAVTPKDFTNCHHNKLILDEHLRICRCQDCGEVLDAFNWLQSFARSEYGAIHRLQFLNEETRKRHEKVEALKKEEQNVKNRHLSLITAIDFPAFPQWQMSVPNLIALWWLISSARARRITFTHSIPRRTGFIPILPSAAPGQRGWR